MAITLKITTLCAACAFWGMLVGAAYVTLPQTPGTLLWCKTKDINGVNQMDQLICAPHSVKSKRNQ